MSNKLEQVTVGDILEQEFMLPLGLTFEDISKETGIPVDILKGIVKGTERINPNIALALSGYFKTTDRFWINLQVQQDLDFLEMQREGK